MTARDAILATAQRLRPHGVHLFFKHGVRFCDPLVPAQWRALADEPALEDPAVERVVLELLPGLGAALERGIYSPVPIARGLEAGRPLERLLEEFRYAMIVVDEEQRWSWMGRPVAPRVQSFLLEHLGWEPAVERWYFEYQVSPEWWDKSYLDAAVTPVLAVAVAEQGGALVATLASGARVALDPDSLRLDRRERLFAASDCLGEVLCSDAARFSILKRVNEACDAVELLGRWRRLRWPVGGSEPGRESQAPAAPR